MESNDLGMFKDYGNYIISLVLILYGALFSFLHNQYGEL